MISKTSAPKIVGMPNIKENFDASLRFIPINRAAVIAVPERDAPGIRAKHWKNPINKAPYKVNSNKLLSSSYRDLIESGVAREQARMILPMCTKTHIYMTGTLRSWIHFFKLRDDGHAQKEIQLFYKRNEYLAIQYCGKMIIDEEKKFIDLYNNSKKKDDLSDSYLQGIYYLNK